MNDIEFLILKNSIPLQDISCINPNDKSYEYKFCLHELARQAKELSSLKIDIREIQYEEIPSKVNSAILCILDSRSLIPTDYITRIIAINNLHRSASFFCGPIFTDYVQIKLNWLSKNLLKTYRVYNLGEFDGFISGNICGDFRNYPPIYGNIFIGSYYNAVGGYSPLISPRGPIHKNPKFFQRLEGQNKEIIYSTRLSTGYAICRPDTDIENFSSYYYGLGYQDGISLSSEDSEQQYIRSNNMLHIDDPSWIIQGPDSNNESYKDHLTILKCQYDLGFAEAKLKTRIV